MVPLYNEPTGTTLCMKHSLLKVSATPQSQLHFVSWFSDMNDLGVVVKQDFEYILATSQLAGAGN